MRWILWFFFRAITDPEIPKFLGVSAKKYDMRSHYPGPFATSLHRVQNLNRSRISEPVFRFELKIQRLQGVYATIALYRHKQSLAYEGR